MSRLDFRRSQHLSSLSPVSRWQRDHEGSRRNAIGEFRCGHGLCAGDGGRLGAELAGAQISAHRATAAVDTKARYIDAFALSSPTSDVAVRTWRRVHAVQFPAAPQ